MKKLLSISAAALCCVLGIHAQSTNVVIPPGKLAVFKAGDDTGYWNISTSRAQPCFVQVFDTETNDQLSPLYSLALPTNAPNAIWINDHAGSEGGGISRAANRQYLAIEGYTGDILSPTNAKPSSDTNVTRGFGTVDVFGNEQVLYSDLANWFGLPPGVAQNNPTGIVTADGTNFWGTGNVTGTSAEASGTLFYNSEESATPIELQNYIQAAAEARIIGGTLYIVVPGGGVYNFLDPQNNDAVAPLPYDPNVPNPIEHIVLTNLFLNWGSTYQNIANFDMNAAGTIAYGADQTFGIVKFVNTGGNWQAASYLFSPTNLGTTAQAPANQGCFGICVDFTGTNPVIYATTMENGTAPPANNQGNANQNRIIRIVDTGVDPGTNLVAETLATATSTNETFRGIDFTPDVTPLITSQPAPYSTVAGGSAFFAVTAQSVYPLSYQWLQNGGILTGDTSPNLSLNGVDISLNGDEYECVVSNAYGAVTSAPAALTVTATVESPQITNAPSDLTNYIAGQETFPAILPMGTEPFVFQWYFAGNPLSDSGGKYGGSLTSSLTVSNLQAADAGSYYLVASNSAGAASNLVDVLSVQYHVPSVTTGEPASATAFLGQTFSMTANASGGTPPLTYQWYDGTTALQTANEYSGTASQTLTINPVGYSDAGSYTLVISNPGGSTTSQVATLTVLAPPPPSYIGYSNQLYVQNFNSLQDPGSNSVNSINNPKDAGSIDGNAYSLANPFDFAYPIITSSYAGGLGLGATMPGWYGAADTLYVGVDGITRFGAQDGDQTTGGVIDFGPNDSGALQGTNRALGLLSTSTTGSTTFAVKLINETSSSITNVSMSFIGELWHNGTSSRVMSFGYTEDPSATNFLLTAQSITNSVLVSNLAFSFPTAKQVTTIDGTQSGNQVSLATNNMGLAAPWTPGGALWLIWSINYYGTGSGNGYAIDNLAFSNASPPTVPGPSYVAYATPNSSYTQDFDSLPYEPTNSVNTANPVTINDVTYGLANPFDFAGMISNASGGLGLSETMPGWYGAASVGSKFGASAGDQTTGGDVSFGPTNTPTAATNRSLGLLATSTSGETAFGVRLLNLTGDTLGQFNLAYSSELWRQTTTAKVMTNYYYLDLTGTNGFVT
ncbi:MAG TPA: immunoglobulin domain-containing protein, partial [Verrucomicrobiae bacterium]|nr:immunoglobulin domain-containing protein [Verrucomicrobiae bacterium]